MRYHELFPSMTHHAGVILSRPNRAPHRNGREAAHFGLSASAPARGRER